MILFESIFIFSLCAVLGSFGNVVVLRLPKGESVVRPRSHCPKCKKQIAAFDNIPLLSFIFLRGKCRQCHDSISYQYPLVELITGLLFLFLYLKFGLTFTFAELALFAWGGVVVSFIDLEHRILPDVFTIGGMVVGLLGAWLNPDRHFSDALIGLVAGAGFLFAVAFIYSALRKEEGMGGGDIKLLGWVGAVLGWHSVIFTIFVSSILGSVMGLGAQGLANRGKSSSLKSSLKATIPFGPFLVAAALIYVFFGEALTKVYLNFFFPAQDL